MEAVTNEMNTGEEVVPFLVIKWPPNQIIVATQKGDHGSDSDWKLVPTIIDKNNCITFSKI